MLAAITLCLAAADAFLYTYTTEELVVTVSSETFVSTVLGGSTYEVSFLAPSVTTYLSATTDSSFELSENGISYVPVSSNGALPTDTATTFTTNTGSNTTTTLELTTAVVQTSAVNTTTFETSSVYSTENNTNTSSAANGEARLGTGSGYVLGALMAGALLL